jgi:hypothetical protein
MPRRRQFALRGVVGATPAGEPLNGPTGGDARNQGESESGVRLLRP